MCAGHKRSNDCSFETDDLGRIYEGGKINVGLSGFEVLIGEFQTREVVEGL